MPLRKATYGDIPHIAVLLSKAFYNDPLNEYFFPARIEYPEDYVSDFSYETTIGWWKYDRIWLVSCDDAPAANIKGVICWTKRGPTATKTPFWNVSWWDPRPIIARVAIALYDRQRRTSLNRAMRTASESDPAPVKKYDFGATMGPFVEHFFSEEELDCNGHWEVSLLAVDPDAQRQGVGAELIEWGVDQARAEGLPCVVISSTGSEKWYQKQGFEIYVGCAGTADRVVDGVTMRNPMKGRVASGGHIYMTKI